jgi:hypothetical protein
LQVRYSRTSALRPIAAGRKEAFKLAGMTMTKVVVLAVLAATNSPPGKLPSDVSKEMMEAIVAANKSLGLESWPMHNIKPCIDRGGQGITAKDVTPEETRKCAAAAVDKAFPELGKSYVLAIPMADVGPVTVMAIGIGGGAGWGAYSCDPDRKCLPVKVGAPNKWGKRIAERIAKACAEATTLWLPADKRACAGSAPATSPSAAASAPATPSPPAATAPPPAATTPPPAKH